MKKLTLQNCVAVTLFLFFFTSCNESPEFNPNASSNDQADLSTSGSTAASSTLLVTDVWQFATSTPAGKFRIGAATFAIGENAYVGTGFTGLGNSLSVSKDFWKYNPSTNVWTQIADFGGEARANASGFGIGEKGYVGTGEGTTRLKDFWEYNSLTNEWAPKKDFGGGARIGASSLVIGKKGYVGTGLSNSSLEKDFWEYDPSTNDWIRKADFRGAGRLNAVGFVLNSRNGQLGYLGGGNFGTIAPGQNYTDFWQYLPASDIWRQRADLPENFPLSGYFSIGSKGYLVANSKLWMFDPLTSQAGSWIPKANFPGGVMVGGFGFASFGQGYIGGGNYSNPVAANATSFYKYIPD